MDNNDSLALRKHTIMFEYGLAQSAAFGFVRLGV